MNALAARRRHPAAIALLLFLGLALVGAAYTLVAPKPAQAATPTAATADQIEQGRGLFLANCASCHGLAAEGTKSGISLIGVGAAAVDFQVGTGRMPLPGPNVQSPRQQKIKFTQEQIDAMAAYVASLAPGPAVPTEAELNNPDADIALGGDLYRINCAMCHNAAGAGGALTRGKYAPSLHGVEAKHIWEALESGPGSMPVFSDGSIDAKGKASIIKYLQAASTAPSPGGMTLGSLGPVSEGMFIWVFGLGLMIVCAYWLGQKAA